VTQEIQLLFSELQVQPEERLDVEQLGSKPKFWFERDKTRWLFKEARENTGEDWAEKIASEIAAVLGVAAATVELAVFNGKLGCASRSFVNRDLGQHLIHGNELLAGTVIGYDRNKRMHQTDHTLDNIYRTIKTIFPNEKLHTEVLKKLASYLILDALIGNTDRHHENWGLLLSPEMRENSVKLTIDAAPTFDHASSLGRELRDERRINILQNKRVGEYVRAGKGGIYVDNKALHGANPLRIAEFGVRQYPQFFKPVLNSIAGLSEDQLCTIIDRVPAHRMSDQAREFARSMLSYSLSELQRLNQ
jgi:hypothetical protein